MGKNTVITIALLLAVVMTGCRATVNVPLVPATGALQEKVLEGEGKDKILLLNISGFISGSKRTLSVLSQEPSLQEEIREALHMAETDSDIRGLILRINSPGGTVTSTDIIYHDIIRFKKKRGTRIIASLMDVAASGGYYIATAADEIIAHPTTITGSIGVIALKFNVEGLMNRLGIRNETVKSVEMKDLWSPFRASTQEERKIIQDIIDRQHKIFCDTITKGRKSLTEADVEKLADGRIYSADQALEAGLIDGIGYLDDAIESLKKNLKIEKAKIITYSRPGAYKGTIYSGNALPSPTVINLLSIDEQTWISHAGVHFMYLWLP
jgi:protease-4